MGFKFINGVRFQERVLDSVEYVKSVYATTRNEEIAKETGISVSTLHRLAHALGVAKDEYFMRRVYANNIKAAQAEQRRTGNYNSQNLIHASKTQEEKEEIYGKIKASMVETYKAERRRINWGLPQKTKLHIAFASRKKYKALYRLKRNGYIEVDKNRFLRPAEPHERQEKFLTRKYGFIFLDDEDERLHND